MKIGQATYSEMRNPTPRPNFRELWLDPEGVQFARLELAAILVGHVVLGFVIGWAIP